MSVRYSFQVNAYQTTAFQQSISISPGSPAFQGAFDSNSYQAGVMLVAAAYAVGSPVFATPTLTIKYTLSVVSYSLQSPDFATPGRTVIPISVNTYTLAPLGWPLTPPSLHQTHHLSANAYSLGSPTFAKPTIYIPNNPLTAYGYSLGSPVFARPAISQVYALHVSPYSLNRPDFGVAIFGQNYRLFVNSWSVHSPDFGHVGPITINYKFIAPSYSLGPLYFRPPDAPIEIQYTLRANDYWLQSPWPDHAQLIVEIKPVGYPMSYFTAAEDAADMLTKLLNLILQSVPPQQTPAGDQLRRFVSIVRADAQARVRGSTLGTDLQVIYDAADKAGATWLGMDNVRKFLMSQVASKSVLTQAIYRSALIMTLGEQSKIISRFQFKTQAQVQNLMVYMTAAFDSAKALGIDEVDVLVYQTLTAMGGALTNHLATTELQVPRYVSYRSGMPMPSLYLAQRIYADPSRSDEIEAENDVINPAFCPINLRVLSTAILGTTQYGGP